MQYSDKFRATLACVQLDHVSIIRTISEICPPSLTLNFIFYCQSKLLYSNKEQCCDKQCTLVLYYSPAPKRMQLLHSNKSIYLTFVVSIYFTVDHIYIQKLILFMKLNHYNQIYHEIFILYIFIVIKVNNIFI